MARSSSRASPLSSPPLSLSLSVSPLSLLLLPPISLMLSHLTSLSLISPGESGACGMTDGGSGSRRGDSGAWQAGAGKGSGGRLEPMRVAWRADQGMARQGNHERHWRCGRPVGCGAATCGVGAAPRTASTPPRGSMASSSSVSSSSGRPAPQNPPTPPLSMLFFSNWICLLNGVCAQD